MKFLVALLLTVPSPNTPGKPRACRDSVSVVSDGSVERVGPPGSDSLVRWLPRSRGPEFPRALLSLRQGSVMARFVVDTSGRVIKGTAVILSESDRGFGRSVCQFLEQQARFDVRPVDGKKSRIEVRSAQFLFQMGQ
jgi:outer membrane biosynthesis protein TonB